MQLGRSSSQKCIRVVKGSSRRRQIPTGKVLLTGLPASRLEPFTQIPHTVPRLLLPTGHHPNSLTRYRWLPTICPLPLFDLLSTWPPALPFGHLSSPPPRYHCQRAKTEHISLTAMSPTLGQSLAHRKGAGNTCGCATCSGMVCFSPALSVPIQPNLSVLQRR